MLINFVNTCHLNVIVSVYMIFRLEICIGSFDLEVFSENCCFTRYVLSWLAGHAKCHHGGKLATESTFSCWCVARAGMTVQRRVNDSF